MFFFFFYRRRANYQKHSVLKRHKSIISVPMGQESDVFQLRPRLSLIMKRKCQLSISSSGVLTGEGYVSRLLLVVNRIQFLMVVGLRSVLSYQLQTSYFSQLLEPTLSSLPCGPLHLSNEYAPTSPYIKFISHFATSPFATSQRKCFAFKGLR